jgi:hypothetical protein
MAVTRIKNNQITDSSAGNAIVGINASTKIQDNSITAGKIANNLTYGSDLTITGNLTVNGQTTTIDTVSTVIEDPIIVLASNQTGSPTVDIGFIGERGTSENIAFVWDESAGEFVTGFTTDLITNTVVTISSYANFHTNNANVAGNLVINGTTSLVGNVTSALNVTGSITGGNLLTAGLVSATGNITGGNVSAGSGLIATTGNINGANLNATTGVTASTVSATSTVTGGNLATGGTVSATSTVTGGNIATGGTVSAGGNITANPSSFFIGNGSQLTGVVASSANAETLTGVFLAPNVLASSLTSVGALTSLSVVGTTQTGNLATGGTVSATGTATAGNIATGGTVSATATITGGNLATGGTVSSTGTVTGGNVATGGTVSATSTITGGNVATGGTVSAAGTATVGNLATGGTVSATGTITSADTITGGNVATGGTVSATGNITGANVLTGGLVSSTGTVTGGNIATGGTVSATGTITGGNVATGGTISGTGTITGGNLATGGTVSAAGTATAGNIATGGTVSATSTITGGNIATGGTVSATGTITSANTITGGNLATGGTVSATGNITGGNILTSGAVDTNSLRTLNGLGNLTITAGNIVLASANSLIEVNNAHIHGVATPTDDSDAANKAYVDNKVTTGISYHDAVLAATVGNLNAATGGTVTYAQPNGAGNGQGATLTTTGTFNLIDTANIQTVGTRILVKNQANAVQNGVYVWSNSTTIVRSTDTNTYGPADANALSINDYFFVQSGNVNAGSAYIVDAPTGTITFGTSDIEFAQFSSSQIYTANTSAGLSLIGTVFNAKVDTTTIAFNGSGQISIPAGATLTTPNIGAATGTSVSVTGTVTAASVVGGVITGTSASVTGTITGGDTITGGNIATGGTVSAAGTATVGNIATGGTVSATATITGGNIATGGTVSATGNVTGGNVLTGGLISATGSITGGSLVTSGTANVTGTVTGGNISSLGFLSAVGTATVGNLATAGTVSATGTATAGNVATGGTISATGTITSADTITGGNIATGGTISGTGNITGGNVLTGGLISATSTVTGGNLATGGTASVGGNITGANLLTGGLISATSTITSSATITGGNIATGGTVSAGGNITANPSSFFIGNGSQLTGVTASSANAETLTGVFLAPNVLASSLTSVGALTSLSVVGTTTTGNLATGGTVSATSTITGGNVATGGTVSATATITGGNVDTGGTVSATGNITGGNIATAGQLKGGNIVISGDDITDTNGRVNFNTAGGDVDFAVNGDTVANVFYIDAGTGTASFGSATQTTNSVVAFNATNSILMPVGNTQQRPAGVTGQFRFNTTINSLELYDNSAWVAVGQPDFTLITDQQFNGDGSTAVFTLSANATTAGSIVSINGVQQIPTIAYAVTGTTLTFTEAPAAGDLIDVRVLVTTTQVYSISNSAGTAVVAVQDGSNVVAVTGDLSVAGTIIGGNINSTAITSGTSNMTVVSNGGNIRANIAGTTVQTISAGLVAIQGDLSVTGNATLSGNILGDRIQNGTTSFDIQTASGNANISVGGTSNVAVFSTAGLTLGTGSLTTGSIVNANANGVGNIGSSTNAFNTVFAKATSAQYADLAEKYTADAEYAPGTVVSFGGDAEVTLASADADRKVAGVVSTNPSYIMNSECAGEFVATVALTGRVPCQVTGSVKKGDLMVVAGNGKARAEADPKVGTVIGKALADSEGDATIEVVVGRF